MLVTASANGHSKEATTVTTSNISAVETVVTPTTDTHFSKFTGSNGTQTTSPIRENSTSADFMTAVDAGAVPPDHEGRTLVLCFDGTGDQFDSDVMCCALV